MAPATPPLINPSLRTNGGDDGAAGALASATSAEKFLLRLDRAKATAERGRTEPIGLEDPQVDPQGDPEDRTETGGMSEGGRPEKAPPRTTKPPPVTHEDAGDGDLDSEEEDFDDDDEDGLERCSVANDRTDGGRPKEDEDEALDVA